MPKLHKSNCTFVLYIVTFLFTRRHLSEGAFTPNRRVQRDTSSPRYEFYQLDIVCLPNGVKQEINMKTGAAIFHFDETNSSTREALTKDDFSCHLELETATGYGFHVYINEMRLLTSQMGTECHDFIQFGRDIFHVTVNRSHKFCGERNRIFYGNATDAEKVAASIQGPRMHVEKNDNEMDFWIKIHKRIDDTNDDTTENGKVSAGMNRKLNVVVTVFKHGCWKHDFTYKKCPNTSRCIRKDYFCDEFVSCVWSEEEFGSATDETHCDPYRNGRYGSWETYPSTDRGLFKPSNIPVIIVVLVVIVVVAIILVVAVGRLVRVLQQPGASSSSSTSERRSRTPTDLVDRRADGMQHLCREISEVSPALLSTNSVVSAPSAPPSYEEAVKEANFRVVGVSNSNELNHHNACLSGDPPPYTPTSTG